MLQKLGDHIANCFEQAAEAERRSAEASDETMRADNEKMAKTWRHLARSYQFVGSLERFLLDANKHKKVGTWLTPEATFDPDTITVLAAVYDKAIEGQPASAHEGIAKRIIELASKGELDPDKLRYDALALSMRQPRAAD